MFGLVVGWWCASALAFAPGSTNFIHQYSQDAAPRTAVNLSVTAADGSLWHAIETTEILLWPTTDLRIDLSLFTFPGMFSAPSILSQGRLNLPAGSQVAHYPSIFTSPGAAKLTVLAKENVNQSTVRLEVYNQDRVAFTPVDAPAPLTNYAPTDQAGRAEVTGNPVT